MADGTHIQWADATWNVVDGCTRVSEGCDHCYIERTPPFRMAHRRFDKPGVGGTTGVKLWSSRLDQPLRWRKPRRVFVCSLADLFHDRVPDRFIAEVWAVMALAPQHTFQVLTKRPARMRALLSSATFWHDVAARGRQRFIGCSQDWLRAGAMLGGEPLPNVWCGTSVENQKWADIRIPELLRTPAAVRWLSCEPLLGMLDLAAWLPRQFEREQGGYWLYGSDPHGADKRWMTGQAVGWVVVGGESGPGARPMHPDWARQLRAQCVEAGVPFFFKQWGESLPLIGHREFLHLGPAKAANRDWSRPFGDDVTMVQVGKKAAGRELDGRTWDEYPAVARA